MITRAFDQYSFVFLIDLKHNFTINTNMVHDNTWRAKVAPWCHHNNKMFDTGVTTTLKIQDNTKVLL